MPPVAPSNIKAEAETDSKITVTWNLLSPEEAQGFVLSYTVSYKAESGLDDSMEKIVPGTRNTVLIEGLDANQEYTIVMWANTSAGMGQASSPISTKRMC